MVCLQVPKLAKAANSPTATGYEYIYYDPNAGKVGRSPYLFTDGKGALDLTLKSVFDSPDATTGWILYNDEMPSDAKRMDSSSFGHTKGVMAFHIGSKTALWLLHSWPKFADPGAAGMPTPIYGETRRRHHRVPGPNALGRAVENRSAGRAPGAYTRGSARALIKETHKTIHERLPAPTNVKSTL